MISEIAEKYIGQREISPNKSFEDPEFLKKMQKSGFYSGAPWCGFFCRMVWNEAGEPIFATQGTSIVTIVTSSAVKSINAASRMGRWSTIPQPGAVAVWRTFKDGKPQSTGHMAIVMDVATDSFSTIEGNTTDKGGREGIMVARRFRSYSWTRDNGLRLMGFINPVIHTT